MTISVFAIGGAALAAVMWQRKSTSFDTSATGKAEITSAAVEWPASMRAQTAGAALGEPVRAGASWCPDNMNPTPGDACWGAPVRANPPVVIYLHGRYDDADATAELARTRRVASRAMDRGFAVLALRAGTGTCVSGGATWRCWPDDARTLGASGRVIDGFRPALGAASAQTANPARFVLGFSSGAYFAGVLATQTMLPARAYALASGGLVGAMPPGSLPNGTPILVLAANDDPAVNEALRLDEALTSKQWPHDTYARGGVHDLNDEDINASMTFFDRTQRESVPLNPPLQMKRPRLYSVAAPSIEPSATMEGVRQGAAVLAAPPAVSPATNAVSAPTVSAPQYSPTEATDVPSERADVAPNADPRAAPTPGAPVAPADTAPKYLPPLSAIGAQRVYPDPPMTGGIEDGNAAGRAAGSPGARTEGPAGIPRQR